MMKRGALDAWNGGEGRNSGGCKGKVGVAVEAPFPALSQQARASPKTGAGLLSVHVKEPEPFLVLLEVATDEEDEAAGCVERRLTHHCVQTHAGRRREEDLLPPAHCELGAE